MAHAIGSTVHHIDGSAARSAVTAVVKSVTPGVTRRVGSNVATNDEELIQYNGSQTANVQVVSALSN